MYVIKNICNCCQFNVLELNWNTLKNNSFSGSSHYFKSIFKQVKLPPIIAVINIYESSIILKVFVIFVDFESFCKKSTKFNKVVTNIECWIYNYKCVEAMP